MNFYIYSITYWGDELETKREEGIMVACSYVDAMSEIEEWDLSVEEVRLREVSGEYQQGPDCENPWIPISDLEEAFEKAGIQLSNKHTYRCSCGEKDENPALSYGGDCANDK